MALRQTVPSRLMTVGGWTFQLYSHERAPGPRGEVAVRPTLSGHCDAAPSQLACAGG